VSKEIKKRDEWVWSPEEAIKEFDRMVEEFKKNWVVPWVPMRMHSWERNVKMPRIDMDDHGDHYEVNVEIPGISQEAVQVHLTKRTLEVQAEIEEEKEVDKEFIVRERNHSEVYRRITFPEEIIPEDTEAIVGNGVLKVTAPKKEKTEEKVRVEVKSA
jgi:HSP20 family protein